MKECIAEYEKKKSSFIENATKANSLSFLEDDRDILRFLRARKWDLQLSFEMLINCVNWRSTITNTKC